MKPRTAGPEFAPKKANTAPNEAVKRSKRRRNTDSRTLASPALYADHPRAMTQATPYPSVARDQQYRAAEADFAPKACKERPNPPQRSG